jgi:hypothetical protein
LLSGRFKAIGFGFNFDEAGAPSFIKSYNGKPVLFAAGGSKPQNRHVRENREKMVCGLCVCMCVCVFACALTYNTGVVIKSSFEHTPRGFHYSLAMVMII